MAAVTVYLCILYGVCSWRYYKARKSVGSYAQALKKISDIYVKEEKGSMTGRRMEEKEHDRFT